MKVIGLIYKGNDQYGDFNWMINQEDYYNCLFIFNDNLEHHFSPKVGAGNAIIRKYNCYNKKLLKPRSFGIPTGTMKNGGFDELTIEVKFIIDKCFEHLKQIIKKYNYDTIIFSRDKDKDKDKLGTSLFEVDSEVIDYITTKLYELDDTI